ncbi:Protein of unknown function (DUF2730) [uncultured phage_MedDCM-OCT-S28-C10]|uniref:Uncharacterized protein n=1 Tax=uncultured phage_MedDCM-OCT-S28-C10 TaxID=2741077 RepID=A0A6S4PDF3_9CAUD|nr:Protein of unknown function (DUF2730) [uncultured phage_MedDCM-OCT-S28-C10]BAQ94058.1 Protein of unknown function (DUF2730) [uncultured phage_MedDCM-OCT-S28-C10]BAR25260.1 hypothetical protein [uncultured Mediterranean phage uvMED]BAR25329.1 hypothetical protein [uncultured Mediterranean phage uvMED]
MDIKSIGVGLGIVMTIAGVLMSIGSVMNRLEVLEAKTAPDIKPLVERISILEGEQKVLQTKIEQLKTQNENPLR